MDPSRCIVGILSFTTKSTKTRFVLSFARFLNVKTSSFYFNFHCFSTFLISNVEKPLNSSQGSFNLLQMSPQVSWVRHRDVHLLTVGRYTYTSDQRFRAIHQPHSEDWTLQIKYPQHRDSGVYECQVSSTPHMSHFIHLTVIGKYFFFRIINF